jgi:hypothetical protein
MLFINLLILEMDEPIILKPKNSEKKSKIINELKSTLEGTIKIIDEAKESDIFLIEFNRTKEVGLDADIMYARNLVEKVGWLLYIVNEQTYPLKATCFPESFASDIKELVGR